MRTNKLEEKSPKNIVILLKKCSNIYAFLGRIYEKEVSADFLKELFCLYIANMKGKNIQQLEDSELKRGFILLSDYLEGLKMRPLKQVALELAEEYAGLFLGVKGLPHPSESAYKVGYMMGETCEKVSNFYKKVGFNFRFDLNEPPDHIAVELYFIAYLYDKIADCLLKGKDGDAKKYIQVLRDFLKTHVLSWIAPLTENVLKAAKNDFYKGLAIITRRFVEINDILIMKLIEENLLNLSMNNTV